MNINLIKTLKTLEQKVTAYDETTPEYLYKAYDIVIRLRSQLLGVIYEREAFGKTDGLRLAECLTEGEVYENTVTLIIHEPLPQMKELTAAVRDHWLELIHTAVGKAADGKRLPYFNKAFVWIEVITPKGTNNAMLWDTSNRAVNLVINNLKGIFFEDDNLEHMAFGVIGRWGEIGVTIVRVMQLHRLEWMAGQFTN